MFASSRPRKSKKDISIVYKWRKKKFVFYQRLNTDAAQCWKFFAIDDNVSFLKLFFMFHRTREQSSSSFYGFEFSRFIDKYILYQTTSFQFQFFLAVANYGKDSKVQGNSTIFKWHKRRKRFKEFQIIPTWTARDFEHFVMNGEHYLAVANHAKGIIYT